MQSLQKQVGNRIRELRESQGISQEALAGLCDLHRTYIGLIERGERNLSLTTLETIAEALQVPVSELLGGTVRPARPVRAASKPKTAASVVEVLAHIETIRQILIEAKLTDAKHYDELYIAMRPTISKPIRSK